MRTISSQGRRSRNFSLFTGNFPAKPRLRQWHGWIPAAICLYSDLQDALCIGKAADVLCGFPGTLYVFRNWLSAFRKYVAYRLVSCTNQKGSGQQNRYGFLCHGFSLLLLVSVYRIILICTIRFPYSILTVLSCFFLTFPKVYAITARCCAIGCSRNRIFHISLVYFWLISC